MTHVTSLNKGSCLETVLVLLQGCGILEASSSAGCNGGCRRVGPGALERHRVMNVEHISDVLRQACVLLLRHSCTGTRLFLHSGEGDTPGCQIDTASFSGSSPVLCCCIKWCKIHSTVRMDSPL